MERLRRFPKGADQYVKGVFARDLMAALDRLGVEPGDEFVVAPLHEQPSLLDPPDSQPNSELKSGVTAPSGVGDNHLGGFRKDDPDTSRNAAVFNYPRSGSQRHTIFVCIARSGFHGRTASEIAEITGIEYRSATPRIGELKNGGWVRASGQTRKTNMNADADVLVLTDKGLTEVSREELVQGG